MSILCESYSKIFIGNDFVNKTVELSLDLILKIFIKPFFCKSCVKKNFGEMCLVLSPLIYLFLIWAMHAVLSSLSSSSFLWLTRDRIPLGCVGSWILNIHILVQHHKEQLIWHDLMMLMSMFILSIIIKLQCRHM
jgi:hypothetical protein